jgi:hypothetical protein
VVADTLPLVSPSWRSHARLAFMPGSRKSPARAENFFLRRQLALDWPSRFDNLFRTTRATRTTD